MKPSKMPSPNELRNFIEYDSETGLLFWKERYAFSFKSERDCKAWNSRFAGKQCFNSEQGDGYLRGRFNSTHYLAHRIAWSIFTGINPEGEIDHINGVRHDNRIENLRDVDRIVNQRNRVMNRNNLSGHNGVWFCNTRGKWGANICTGKGQTRLGYFGKKEQAVKARIDAQYGLGFTYRHGLPIT